MVRVPRILRLAAYGRSHQEVDMVGAPLWNHSLIYWCVYAASDLAIAFILAWGVAADRLPWVRRSCQKVTTMLSMEVCERPLIWLRPINYLSREPSLRLRMSWRLRKWPSREQCYHAVGHSSLHMLNVICLNCFSLYTCTIWPVLAIMLLPLCGWLKSAPPRTLPKQHPSKKSRRWFQGHRYSLVSNAWLRLVFNTWRPFRVDSEVALDSRVRPSCASFRG